MNIKKFTNNDIQNVVDLCNKSMNLDKITESLLLEKTIDDSDFNSEITLLAFNDDSADIPIGFIQGLIRDRKEYKVGYVKLFCVDPDFRKKGIGTELYKIVEDYFVKFDIKLVRVYESYPNYFMPGIDPFYTEAICFFERHGFHKFNDCSNLDADLTTNSFDTSDLEKKLLSDGLVFRQAEKKDYDLIMKWTLENFEAWKGELNNAFLNHPVTLHLCELNGEIIAFSAYDANNKGTGWFGPMGTTEAARGKGVGGILLKRCLKDIKHQGFSNAIIPWVGPIPFYMHYADARVKRIFWRYEKKLE